MGEDKRFGVSGADEFVRLRDELRTTRQAFSERSDDTALRDAFWIAEKKLRLFRSEHDAAGAFKFKKFGRETAALAAKGISAEQAADRRLLFVNMGELDRFNKEGGGHEAGDAALRETVRTIERAIREAGGKDAPSYKVFRYSGNEYVVSFDDVSESKADEIRLRIESSRPMVSGVREGAPLTSVRVDLSEALSIVRAEEAGLGMEFDADDLSRELVGAVRRLADWSLENEKLVTRAERVAAKLDDPDAEAFFENYMKKSFAETELSSVDAFRSLLASAGPENFRATVERVAFERARRRFVGDRSFDGIVRDIVATRVEARRAEMRELNSAEPGVRSVSSADVRLADVPTLTIGQRALENARLAYESARKGGSERGAEVARLDWEIERARRDAGTGLLERGEYYERLEARIQKGENLSVVFVDMGFLKYFDQKGGVDVGDAALRTAADAMEKALGVAGVRGEVYRYGGDEFTIAIDGDAEAARAVIRAIARSRHDAGRIPSGPLSRREYAPTKLVFNYGYADRPLVDAVWDDMVRAGAVSSDVLSNPSEVANRKAEILTAAADVSLEESKSVNRLMLLINEMRDSSYQDPARRQQVESLIDHSKKSVFAERGGEVRLRSWAVSEASPINLLGEIEAFVNDEIRAARDKDRDVRSVRDELIESHVRIRQLEEKLMRAQRFGIARERKVADLASRLRQANEEKQAIIALRRRLAE